MIKEKIYNYEKARNAGISFEQFLKNFLNDKEDNLDNFMPEVVKFDIFEKFGNILQDMKKVVSNGKKIAIIGDYDVDGMTSSSIMFICLSKIFNKSNIIVIIPDRKDDGYGIKKNLVDKANKNNAGFIITVDNGINAIKAIKYAESLGITVFLTDHHLPNDNSYNDINYCMNPHTSNNSLKEKEVCGAYVALLAGLKLLRTEGIELSDKFVKELKEIASIGTIADCMPIRYENRALLSSCMSRFKNGVVINKGLQILISSLGKFTGTGALEQDNIAFYLTPCLNASGRLESAYQGFELLTENDLKKISEKATHLVALNDRRKNISSELEEYLVNQIDKDSKVQIINVPNEFNGYSDREIGGVIGIVAQKVVEASNCPSLIFYNNRFSGRSKLDVNLNKLLSLSKTPTFVFGGHSQACGGGVDFEKYGEALKKELSEKVSSIEEIAYDNYIRIPESMDPLEILKAFEALKPCDLTVFPSLMMENVKIEKSLIFGEKHTQISFKLGDKLQTAMKFYSNIKLEPGTTVKRIVFKVTPSSYKIDDYSIIIEKIVE